MTAAIDHTFFPHIISEIVAQCDFKTQNMLRLLCASMKLEVDRFQCRSIRVYIDRFDADMHDGTFPMGPEEVVLTVLGPNGVPLPFLRRAESIPDKVKTLQMTSGIHPPHAFALRSACTVTTGLGELLWDHVWTAKAMQNGTSYSSPFQLLRRASRMDLHVGLDAGLGWDSPEGPFTIPPTVRDLYVDYEGEAYEKSLEVSHNCQVVKLRLSPWNLSVDGNMNRFVLAFLKPCVEQLILIVYELRHAVEYVEAVKKYERHPQLRLIVATNFDIDEDEAHRLRQALTVLIGANITVRPRIQSDSEYATMYH